MVVARQGLDRAITADEGHDEVNVAGQLEFHQATPEEGRRIPESRRRVAPVLPGPEVARLGRVRRSATSEFGRLSNTGPGWYEGPASSDVGWHPVPVADTFNLLSLFDLSAQTPATWDADGSDGRNGGRTYLSGSDAAD